MIEWKEETPDLYLPAYEDFPWEMLKIDRELLLEYFHSGYFLFFKEEVWEDLWTIGRSSPLEVGGLLLGVCYSFPGHYFWYVDDFVFSEPLENTHFSLRISPEVWQLANEKIKKEKRLPGMILGWFHTHPHFEAFFSATDRTTQKHYFQFSFALGIVFNPYSREDIRIYTGPESVPFTSRYRILDIF